MWLVYVQRVCVCLCMCIYIYIHISLSLSLSLPLSLSNWIPMKYCISSVYRWSPHEFPEYLHIHWLPSPQQIKPCHEFHEGGLEDHSDTKNGPFFSGSTVRLGMGNPIKMNSWPRNNWKILPIKPDFFPWQFLPWVGSQSCHWRDAFRTDRASFASLRPERTQRKLRKMVG